MGAIPLLDKEGARGWLTAEIFLALAPLGERVTRASAFFSRGRPSPAEGLWTPRADIRLRPAGG
jgi:hypothetical protein